MTNFKNDDLAFEIEEIKKLAPPITVSKEMELDFDCPYALDIETISYWYAEQAERDADYELLKTICPNFSYYNG
jgi:hypothetical protein